MNIHKTKIEWCSHTWNLVPMGYPFPRIARVEDCELIERHYEAEPQSEEHIKALQAHGLTGYIDVRSACFHGII